jgi:hypothetical protein
LLLVAPVAGFAVAPAVVSADASAQSTTTQTQTATQIGTTSIGAATTPTTTTSTSTTQTSTTPVSGFSGVPPSSVGGSVAQAQAAFVQWQAWLSAPAQVAARQASQSSFDDQSGSQALSTDSTAFPGWIGQPGYTSGPGAQDKVVGTPGKYSETVQNADGSHGVLVSSLPLDGTTPSGSSAPLDLTLSSDGAGSFEPRSSLVPVMLPSSSTGELSFPQAGFGVSFATGAAVVGQ